MRSKRKKIIWQFFWTPCKRTKHFQRCKDIDKNIRLFGSFNFFFIWPQLPSILKAKSDKFLDQYAFSWHLTIYVFTSAYKKDQQIYSIIEYKVATNVHLSNLTLCADICLVRWCFSLKVSPHTSHLSLSRVPFLSLLVSTCLLWWLLIWNTETENIL